MKPLSHYDTAGSSDDFKRGLAILKEGKVGAIIFAGGQGSRLGTSVPKGLLPISITGKSLLQLFCDKAKSASKRAGKTLPLAIMTSEKLIEGSDSVFLFPQKTRPFVDDEGAPIPGTDAPDGNGKALHCFYESGLYALWKKQGIDYISILPIDNPLADPFDPELIGYHARCGNDVTIKSILRGSDALGVLGEENGKIAVREYTEFPENVHEFNVANIGLYLVNLSFVPKAAALDLPWHKARKKIPHTGVMAWKVENFFFDTFVASNKTGVLVYPRKQIYSPLKNAEGEKSLKTVQADLTRRDREIAIGITGLNPPERPFELDQAFHYPTDELLTRWKGRSLPDCDYIGDES